MKGFIEEVVYMGTTAIKAENEYLECILVPQWGSNLISLVHKESSTEILRTPKSAEDFWAAPVLYGVPILFPPNRIEDGTFTFDGRTYQFEINETDKNNHIHGFLFKEKWELVKAEVAEDRVILQTEIDISQHSYIYEQFPHHVVIQMTYILEGRTLHKYATIMNKGQTSFPWGLGYHTTFLFRETSSLFALTAEKQWELNERALPTGTLKTIAYEEQLNQGTTLNGLLLDDVFLSPVLSTGRNEAVIQDCSMNLQIIYRADENFQNWVVYNADGKQGFVCPEPYTWVTNAVNLSLPSSLTGLQVLQPKEQITVKTEICVSAQQKE